MAVAVDADAAEDGRPDDVLGQRLPVAGGMAVDEIALVFLDLVLGEDDAGQLADAGVDAVHDLSFLDLVFEHGPALFDALPGLGGKGDGFVGSGDPDDILDGQVLSVQDDGHD